MSKISFINNPKPFKEALDSKIEHYFSSQNLDKKGNWKLYHKTIVLFVILFGAYFALFLLQPVSWIHLLLCIAIGLAMSSIGFNVMHDAAHDSYSNNKRLNNFLAFIGGDLMGGSTFFWKIKHNILHHTYTNIDSMDDDIAKYPLFRLSPNLDKKWWHKFQWIYSVPLYAITSIYWLFWDDYAKIFTKKIHNTEINTLKSKDITYLLLGKALNILLFVLIPFIFFGWKNFLFGFMAVHFTMGLTLAFVFQMAHIVEHLEFPIPNVNTQKIDNEWAIHQIKTTANFAMKNKIISWFVGGLNYQVEHHLFPRISHIHYPNLSKIVNETCQEFNIKYNYFPTFRNALKSHFVVLFKMGRV